EGRRSVREPETPGSSAARRRPNLRGGCQAARPEQAGPTPPERGLRLSSWFGVLIPMKEAHMRSIWLVLVVCVFAVIGFTSSDHSSAQQPQAGAVKGGPSKARIVPVVMLKPGETKELLLSTWCTVGLTRGAGLLVRETAETAEGGKIWKRGGVTV